MRGLEVHGEGVLREMGALCRSNGLMPRLFVRGLDPMKQLAILSHTSRAGDVFAARATLESFSENPNRKLKNPN